MEIIDTHGNFFVLIGEIGVGKTWIINKLCNTNFESNEQNQGLTTEIQKGTYAGYTIVDTPGYFDSKNDPEQLKIMDYMKKKKCIIVVVYTNRTNISLENFLDTFVLNNYPCFLIKNKSNQTDTLKVKGYKNKIDQYLLHFDQTKYSVLDSYLKSLTFKKKFENLKLPQIYFKAPLEITNKINVEEKTEIDSIVLQKATTGNNQTWHREFDWGWKNVCTNHPYSIPEKKEFFYFKYIVEYTYCLRVDGKEDLFKISKSKEERVILK